MEAHQKYWFKAKHFGWGWYPTAWQGWASTVLFVLAVLASSLLLLALNPTTYGPVILYLLWIAFCAIAFVVVSYKKGEKPKWHWGN